MNLVFLLEEPSTREMLKGLLPRFLPDIIMVRYIVFEGKDDLEKSLVRKVRGWQTPNTVFIVLRDQDAGDCRAIKQTLAAKCRDAGRPEMVVRIACRELESWYFGDLAAVERDLNTHNLVRYGNRRQYRAPDEIRFPYRELSRITRNKYQKVSGSRDIGPELSPDTNKSRSFQVFIEGVQRAIRYPP